MAQVGRLSVGVDADTSGLSTGLAKAKGEVSAFEGRIGGLNSALSGLTASFATLAASIGVAGIAGKLVAVQREFDVLNASLITMTGSSAAAEKEFAWLKQFASETPFALNEVVGAFVKMKALGLDPTRESLMSFGNTASAMGKSLSDFIEAVADASTGEFERLKEFGIKSSQQGEQVSLTFRGVTTTIKKSSDEIVGYLEKIGNTDFAGAATQRAKTLDGALSNLGDTWDELFRTVNNNATGTVIYDSVRLATGAIERAIIVIESMGDAAEKTGQQSKAMETVLNGISIVFETIAVLGQTASYWFSEAGRSLGGLIAQLDMLAQGDWRKANTIGLEMAADAKAAYEEYDRLTKAVLNARAAAAGQTPAVGGEGGAAKPKGMAGAAAADGAAKGAAQKGDPLADWIMKQEEADSAYWAGRIAKVQEGLMTEQELLAAKYEQDLARLDAAMIAEEERRIARDALMMEYDAAELERAQEQADKLAEIHKKGEDDKISATERWAKEEARLRMQVANQAISLLSMLGSRSKTAALAAIALQKALAIAEIFMNSEVAQMRAVAELGPIFGPPVAASIRAWSFASMGLVAATGLVQAGMVGGGGASISVGSAPSGSSSQVAPVSVAPTQTIVVQGISSGDLFSGDAVRGLIDKLNDAQRNGARVVVA